jgi:hypothetical protein
MHLSIRVTQSRQIFVQGLPATRQSHDQFGQNFWQRVYLIESRYSQAARKEVAAAFRDRGGIYGQISMSRCQLIQSFKERYEGAPADPPVKTNSVATLPFP